MAYAAAAGTDFDQIDDGCLYGISLPFVPGGGCDGGVANLEFGGQPRPAVFDEGGLCGCAPDVQGDQVLESGELADVRCGDDAGRRPGLDELNGLLSGGAGCDDSAAGGHQEQAGAGVYLPEPVLQPFHVGANRGKQRGVDGGRAGPCVFAVLGANVG